MKTLINSVGFWFVVCLLILAGVLIIGGSIHANLPKHEQVKTCNMGYEHTINN